MGKTFIHQQIHYHVGKVGIRRKIKMKKREESKAKSKVESYRTEDATSFAFCMLISESAYCLLRYKFERKITINIIRQKVHATHVCYQACNKLFTLVRFTLPLSEGKIYTRHYTYMPSENIKLVLPCRQ